MSEISRRAAISRMARATPPLWTRTNCYKILEPQHLRHCPRALRGQHRPRPLTFDPSKLKGLSEKLIRSHWENNYGGAVKALNAVEQRLAAMLKEKDLPAYMYGDLKEKSWSEVAQ
jgi:hypothetical protein